MLAELIKKPDLRGSGAIKKNKFGDIKHVSEI